MCRFIATRIIATGWLLAVGGLVALAAPMAAEIPIEDCLACHADDTLTLVLDDGSEMSLFVDEATYLASRHGELLVCTDCHEGFGNGDHPSGATAASRRAYVIRSYELCRNCHFDTYTRTLESVHYEMLTGGREEVPVCSDCHGAHDIRDPHEKTNVMSRGCGACHSDVYETYLSSVHGSALLDAGPDVPGCADCHTAHTIVHPKDIRFHLLSPEACLDCHGDTELAERYGMSTTVATTYLADFHGVTASLAAASEVEPDQVVVVCVDCHGYHDIASLREVGEAAMQARVREVCASCHADAAPDFPAAWLSHYPPSLDHAPLVFLVGWFYRILIPFMVVGLSLQVGLHLYRAGTRR